MSIINAGTISVTNGSTTVTGTQVEWSTVAAGMVLFVGTANSGRNRQLSSADGYLIASVNAGANPPTLTLVDSYQGSTASSVQYMIDTTGYAGNQTSLLNASVARVVSRMAELLGSGLNLAAGGRRITINKDTAGAESRLLFQILGVDQFRLEQRTISSVEHLVISRCNDGTTWVDVLTINRATGSVQFVDTPALLSPGAITSVASAATVDLGAVTTFRALITGTTTITSFGTVANQYRQIRFGGALTLTHNATSLILPSGANITTAAGDTAYCTSDGSGNWRVIAFNRADGSPVLPSGTASAPALAPNGDSNTGIFYPAADTLAVTTGGTERVRVTSSGNVGIGTTIGTTTVTNGLAINNATAGNYPGIEIQTAGVTRFYINANNAESYLTSTGNTPIVFSSNASERMRISGGGNVGIGATSPVSNLHVFGGNHAPSLSADRGIITLGTSSSIQLQGGSENASPFAFWLQVKQDVNAGFPYPLSLQPIGGNVGIGTLDPASFKLEVAGAIGPNNDNDRNLGSAARRFKELFAGTGTINTSDGREKTPIRTLSDAEKACARELAGMVGAYQWLSSVEAKGADKARIHVGIIAQEVEALFKRHKLNPWRYALLCKDPITKRVKKTRKAERSKTTTKTVSEEVIEIVKGVPTVVTKQREVSEPVFEMKPVVGSDGKLVKNEDGSPRLHPVTVTETYDEDYETDEPAGDRMGVRYDQLLAFCIAGLAS